ncbi:Uncharacterised protein [Chryseobacterium taklimakanense]|uniref:Uncharacterized protein n=1 Tax=Chryseobacterium taklimakanense TaxID=536441 RepID=A0A239X3Q0_9FLAO|nr:hypothetical protein [Chryseobacterium taklimakanense]SNV41282.1 Uncharacterised protein [Chryseobacterium taklimakanense]
MKFILLTILSTIIIFFVWNILKKMFFTSFYQFPKPNETRKKENKNISQKVNWDAETVEYEEIKEPKNGEK